jgi:hypothetical protein
MVRALMLLLDTNILIDVLRGEARALAWLELQERPKISVISWMEILVGCRDDELGAVEPWLSSFPRLELTQAIAREAVAGALLGLLMLVVVVPWAGYVSNGNWLVAWAAGLALVAITTLAATAGAALPLLFDRFGLDPALMSAPFIATATDVAGVFIYLNIAAALLRWGGWGG